MISRKKNSEKGIINIILIISYFLIFTLIIMILSMVKVTFFKDTASDTISYGNYTGSIHIGIDTKAGDYRISNTSRNSQDYVYGIKSSKSDDFTVQAYADDQILQLNAGDHIIIYEANLQPVDSEAMETNSKESTTNSGKTSSSETTSSQNTVEKVTSGQDGMEKLSNKIYNVPYVLTPTTDNSYYELYDDGLNVIGLYMVDSETLISLSNNEASYIKLTGLEWSSLDTFKTSSRLSEDGFEPGVFIGGSSIETGDFSVVATDESCSYRVIDSADEVASTPSNSCNKMSFISIEEGNIVELHGGLLNKHYQVEDEGVDDQV